MIGLGTGTLAAYARPGQFYRFYEIDPTVVLLARTYFSYLSQAQGQIDVAWATRGWCWRARPGRATTRWC